MPKVCDEEDEISWTEVFNFLLEAIVRDKKFSFLERTDPTRIANAEVNCSAIGTARNGKPWNLNVTLHNIHNLATVISTKFYTGGSSMMVALTLILIKEIFTNKLGHSIALKKLFEKDQAFYLFGFHGSRPLFVGC